MFGHCNSSHAYSTLLWQAFYATDVAITIQLNDSDESKMCFVRKECCQNLPCKWVLHSANGKTFPQHFLIDSITLDFETHIACFRICQQSSHHLACHLHIFFMLFYWNQSKAPEERAVAFVGSNAVAMPRECCQQRLTVSVSVLACRLRSASHVPPTPIRFYY